MLNFKRNFKLNFCRFTFIFKCHLDDFWGGGSPRHAITNTVYVYFSGQARAGNLISF